MHQQSSELVIITVESGMDLCVLNKVAQNWIGRTVMSSTL